MAKGLIVKLKSRDPGQRRARSVVRLQASAMPLESAQSQRLRMAAVTQRHRMGYLMQRPTAFAAHLIHSGREVPYAEAKAEADRLRKDPDVEWVIVNEVEHAAAVNPAGTEPDYASQTWLQPRELVSGGRKGVANIEPAWALMDGRSLSQVLVAVLDTGSLPAPDLNGRLASGYDMVSEVEYAGDFNGQDSDPSDPGVDPEKIPTPALRVGCGEAGTPWHGLNIMTMLGAIPNNGLNGAGILAPLAGPVVLPVRVAGMCGAAVSDIIEGMLWAAGVDYQGSPSRNLHPARVINLSFGGDGVCADQGDGARDVGWLYRQTIQTLESKGVLVVASAGNGNPKTGLGLKAATRPANCPGVLAVTALNQAGYKAHYANLINSATQVGLAVAGGDVELEITMVNGREVKTYHLRDDGVETLTNSGTTSPIDNDYVMRPFAGTSAAAPIVAGVAALMLAVDPTLTVDDLRTLLTTRAAPFPTTGFSTVSAFCVPGQSEQGNCVCTTATCGAGILDASQAVSAAINHADTSSGSVPSVISSANTCYFRPDRLGGGNTCPTGGGGGGGSVDAWSLLALLGLTALAAMAAWMQGLGRFAQRRMVTAAAAAAAAVATTIKAGNC